MTQTSFDKARIKILLLEGVHESAVASFREQGYSNITEIGHAMSGDDLCQAIADVHILGLRSRSMLTEQCLAAARRLYRREQPLWHGYRFRSFNRCRSNA